MARDFDGSSQYGYVAATVAEPFSIAGWFQPDGTGVTDVFMALSSNVVATNWWIAGVDAASNKIFAQKRNGASIGSAVSTTTVSAGTWHHFAAVFASNTSRTVYLDGAGKGTNATSVTDPSHNFLTAALVLNGGPGALPFNGKLAELAIWSAALTDASAAALAAGVSPRFIGPSFLSFYAPLIGRASPEPDLIGGNDLTLVNSPANFAHPRMIYPVPAMPIWRTERAVSVATQTLPSLSQSAAGAQAMSAAGTQTLAAPSQVGTGVQATIASGSQTLPALTQAGVGLLVPSAAGAQMLPSTIQTGAGEQPHEAVGAQTLPSLDQAGVALMVGFMPTGKTRPFLRNVATLMNR